MTNWQLGKTPLIAIESVITVEFFLGSTEKRKTRQSRNCNRLEKAI